ncbi:MAG: hypothetical protein MUO82_06400 [Candidatus Thermoplasmatota archaeon]|nr:hypothetical protein [Candidatus Thermoplasmatota archaeon]
MKNHCRGRIVEIKLDETKIGIYIDLDRTKRKEIVEMKKRLDRNRREHI